MAEPAESSAVTVYLNARVYDATIKRRSRLGRRLGGGMRHCWNIKLQRWSPAEVRQIIIDTFTRLADEAAAEEALQHGSKSDDAASG